MATPRIGIWLIGAKGNVATTTVVGLIGLEQRLVGTAGLVSSLPQLEHLDLPDWAEFVVGGHEASVSNVAAADHVPVSCWIS